MSASGKVEKVLSLPKGIHNICAKPYTSSACILSADESVAVSGNHHEYDQNIWLDS